MKHAFSLIELSIVLVILGLLTGAILTGQSLIREAELRAITTEYQTYKTAVGNFRNKYLALPGDMYNAEDLWGTMTSGTCPNATGGTGTQTCNGDGDGLIDTANAASQTGEVFTFWQHLVNAGMIEGPYDGLADSANKFDSTVGENVPASKFPNGGWSVFNWASQSGSTSFFNNTYYNIFVFGTEGTNITTGQILTPEETRNIDKKIDDGLPAQGIVLTRSRLTCAIAADGTTLTTAAGDAAKLDSKYNVSLDSPVCSVIFK